MQQKLAEQPIVPGKLFKHISSSREKTKKQAKEKIKSILTDNPNTIEDVLISFLAGREEHQYVY